MQIFDINFILLTLIWLVPLLGGVFVAVGHNLKERTLARTIRATAWIYLAIVVTVFVQWAGGDYQTLLESYRIPLGWKSYDIDYSLQFDRVAAVFLAMTAFCGMTVVRFSRIYLHKEPGYARFFALIMLLMSGMSILSLADSMPFFFAGWEFVGFASFFLVAFYRRRQTSVVNALKIFAVYRIGDLGLLFGIVIVHLLSEHGRHLTFSSLSAIMLESGGQSSFLLTLLALGIVVSATAKSAQVPFSFWLPRAMEGPTPSSAIFYGALAVHAGVLLLLRMAPVWQNIVPVQIIVGAIGIITAIVATVCGRVQPSIKAQLAYASVTQVGIMFVELACGFDTLVLFHFVTHALLRSFQILVSPSVIAAFMQMQDSEAGNLRFSGWSWERMLPKRVMSSFYVFGLQDGYLESFWRHLIVLPARRAFVHDTRRARHLRLGVFVAIFCLAYFISVTSIKLGLIYALTFLLMQTAVAACFESGTFVRVADKVMRSFLLASFVSAMMAGFMDPIWAVLLGIFPFWLLIRIWFNANRDFNIPISAGFAGMYERNAFGMWTLVFLACGLVGVPPMPSFFAEDILIEPIVHHFSVPSIFVGLSLALNGVAIFRAIAHLGMGEPVQVEN